MRIAVPVTGEEISTPFGACEAFYLYEDDHGRLLRRTRVPTEGGGFDTALAALERCGADVVVCGTLDAEEKHALALAGLLLAPDASGGADEAVRAYLDRAIACDPDNDCNYCGHKDACDLVGHKK